MCDDSCSQKALGQSTGRFSAAAEGGFLCRCEETPPSDTEGGEEVGAERTDAKA